MVKKKDDQEDKAEIAQMKLKKVVRKEPSPEEEAPKEMAASPEPIDTSEVSVPEHGKPTELELYEPKPRETSPKEDTQHDKEEDSHEESKDSVSLKKKKAMKKTSTTKPEVPEAETELVVSKPKSAEAAFELEAGKIDSPEAAVEQTTISVSPHKPESIKGIHIDHQSLSCPIDHHISVFSLFRNRNMMNVYSLM